jgi:hypothetical protein
VVCRRGLLALAADRGLRYFFLTPHVAQDAIVAFDRGQLAAIRTFELRMRPPPRSRKRVRRRCEPPTNAELRGSGLTVAPQQPHVAPQRYTATGERNLDPVDGLASNLIRGYRAAGLHRAEG